MRQIAIGVLIIATGTVLGLLARRYPAPLETR